MIVVYVWPQPEINALYAPLTRKMREIMKLGMILLGTLYKAKGHKTNNSLFLFDSTFNLTVTLCLLSLLI